MTELASILNPYELAQYAGWILKGTVSHYVFLNWTSIADKLIQKKQVFNYG
ncbi:MAG: hypothetical protein ACTSR0_05980 [Candidatus Asgardarchaeia archaeon]